MSAVIDRTTIPSRLALAFVGTVGPDEPAFHDEAFSRAGNLFQTGFLSGLTQAGLSPSLVLAPAPISSHSPTRKLFVRGAIHSLGDGLTIDSPGFINVTPLKQVTIGLMVLWRLLLWGWRNTNSGSLVVCTYNLSVPPGVFTLIATRLIRAKAVALIVDINVPGETVPNSLAFRLDYQLHRWLMPLFDGLVVVSDAIVRDFGLRVPYIRVEGGVRESRFATAIPRSAALGFVIVSAGSLDEANGVRVLLGAFSKLRGDHYRLRIAGAGPLEDEVKSAASQDARIEYCGYLALEDVLRLYASADVLINMRLTKDINTKYFFPSKLMEYLASGRPVISTCTGHVEEEFGQFTFLLRDECPDALAAAIEEVESIGIDARERKGAMAREFMLANKTWSAQGRRVVRLIRSLVAVE